MPRSPEQELHQLGRLAFNEVLEQLPVSDHERELVVQLVSGASGLFDPTEAPGWRPLRGSPGSLLGG